MKPLANLGNHFAALRTFEAEDQEMIDTLLEQGYVVAGVTSSSNSGGVWVVLVDPRLGADHSEGSGS